MLFFTELISTLKAILQIVRWMILSQSYCLLKCQRFKAREYQPQLKFMSCPHYLTALILTHREISISDFVLDTATRSPGLKKSNPTNQSILVNKILCMCVCVFRMNSKTSGWILIILFFNLLTMDLG